MDSINNVYSLWLSLAYKIAIASIIYLNGRFRANRPDIHGSDASDPRHGNLISITSARAGSYVGDRITAG